MHGPEVETALRAAAKNRYWREADGELVVSLWRDSGESMGAFARQWGINLARLRRWRSRLAGRDLPTFHPVSVVTASPSWPVVVGGTAGGSGVEVVVAGRRVVASPGFDEATLLRVVRVLESGAC